MMIGFTMNLLALANELGELLHTRNLKLATAESCTGGQVAETVTAVAGSSKWFERGFVTYSNLAKQEMLGVPKETLAKFGAVSEETVRVMAQGALLFSLADIALAVTGIAGPDGGSIEKPVGTVWFAWAGKNWETETELKHFSGDRLQIRLQATQYALEKLVKFLQC